MKISIIGAGIGGLTVACLLANEGHEVTVFEKNASVGGKMNQIQEHGFRFDTGPSLLTMPFLLEKVFSLCGKEMADYLELEGLNPICRYFYQDGTIFNNYEDKTDTIEEIEKFAPEDADAYSNFLNYSADLYDKTADAFIFNPLFDFQDFKSLSYSSFLGIDAFSTVSNKVNAHFKSPYLRKFFKRFTTYNGSSPFLAPATLNVIPHVELNMGGYYVKGGLYKIAESLHQIAAETGVTFKFKTDVKQITTEKGTASGIRYNNDIEHWADLVITNSDATETALHLLSDADLSPRKKYKFSKIEPSCSGFVLLLGIDKTYSQLQHHNIFFSENYQREFEQIFKEKVMPDDPTIYIANTSHSDSDHAPEGGSNLFILVNAPYLSDQYDWNTHSLNYAGKLIEELEARGLDDLGNHIKFKKIITPEDFYKKYRSNKGSIYGTSSNTKWSAFVRPRNKSRAIDKLYFTGGSTHPGGGIPLVIQSAFNVVDLIQRYESK